MAKRKQFKTWLNIHQAVSLFFLPLVLIYVLTGVLDILGFDRPEAVMESKVDWPAFEAREIQELKIRAFVMDNGLREPQGPIRYYHRLLLWGPRTGMFLSISHDREDGQGLIRVFEPNWFYRLLALHKGQGGAPAGPR